jgi:hypothetical protein
LRIDTDAHAGLSAWLEKCGLAAQPGIAIEMARGAALERGRASGGWALVSQAMG